MLKVVKYFVCIYGNKVLEVVKFVNIIGSWWLVIGKCLLEQFLYIEVEVWYSVQEYVCIIVDFFVWRMCFVFLNVQVVVDVILKIVDIMGKEFCWLKVK